MSEKIYRWLLRLYPSHFRKTYGDAAMQLFRDRSRDERGFISRIRLWCDLLFDLTVSLPREHRRTQPAFAAVAARRSADGIPTFYVLQDGPPRPESFLFGSVLALAALSGCLFLYNHAGNSRLLHRGAAQASPESYQLSPAHGNLGKESHSPVEKRVSNAGDSAAGVTDPAVESVATRAQQTKTGAPAKDKVPGQASEEPWEPQDATNAMIHLFQSHNIVMLGESHGNKQEYEWLCQLVKTPGFADNVDDIVVEHGNSLYQQTVDRYISGEDVPIAQVQKAWRNMISSVPPVSPVYGSFYQAIREANLQHRGKHQIRLLMGGPPGDWDKINSPQDLAPYEAEREQWYAQVVKDQVLAKHHRALLIMGASHFLRGHAQSLEDQLLLQRHQAIPPLDRTQLALGYVERELRAAGANPYLVVFGSNVIDSQGQIDQRFDSWPAPALAPTSGTWLGKLPAQPLLSCGHAPATPLTLGDEADAMLYAAPCARLTGVEVPRAELEGTPYGKEVARRAAIILALPRQEAPR